ncbi:DNA primase family protein [Gemmata sp.]|uniref:DNA primase family protein n=1 Tax=Gemmata sp. TaxID=1914242 RepID=UPI003F6F3FC2
MRAARVVCWGFDLGEDTGYSILAEHYNPRCQPPWSESELRKKCRDAMSRADANNARGWLRDAENPHAAVAAAAARTGPHPADLIIPGLLGPLAPAFPAAGPPTPPGSPPAPPRPPSEGQGTGAAGDDPGDDGSHRPATATTTIGVEDDDPYKLARQFLERFDHPDGCRLRYWAGEFCLWISGAYSTISEDELRGQLSSWTENEFMRTHLARIQVYTNNAEKSPDARDKEKVPTKRRVSRNLVSDVLQAVRGLVAIPSTKSPPCWLGDGPPAAELVAAKNGLVHLPSLVAGLDSAFTRSTPKFFSFNRVAFDFEPDAPCPRQWLNFLSQLWPDDPQSVACLQEWFGYLITPDTSRHKMLLLLGPPRAGKGTIGRVLKALVGELNVAAPTLGKLAEQFGLQDLIGKPVAMIGDARLSGRTDAVAITEELLSISGEDDRTIARKYATSVTMKLPTRFVFLSNEMPQLGDTSGALLGRMVILRLTRSFLGVEDHELLEKLLVELPGILLWAADGWTRLRENGQFTMPESATEIRDEAEAVTSPMRCFIRDRLEVTEDESDFVSKTELYSAWVEWCRKSGRENIDHLERFVVRLRAAMPNIQAKRSRDGSTRTRGYTGLRLVSEF